MTTLYSILLALLAVAAAPQFEVQPLRGPPVAGRLVALDGKRVTLEVAAGRVVVETGRVDGYFRQAETAGAARGSRRSGSTWSTARLLLARAVHRPQRPRKIVPPGRRRAVELPVPRVAAVRFQPAAGGRRRASGRGC